MARRRLSFGFSTAFTLAFLNLFLTAAPLYSIFLALPLSFLFLAVGLYSGFIRRPSLTDLFLVPVITFVLVILSAIIGVFSVVSTGFFVLLVVGLVSDGIAFLLERIPLVGNLLSSVVVFFVVYFAIGGFNGIVLATIASILALFPLSVIPIISITFISIKLAGLLLPIVKDLL